MTNSNFIKIFKTDNFPFLSKKNNKFNGEFQFCQNSKNRRVPIFVKKNRNLTSNSSFVEIRKNVDFHFLSKLEIKRRIPITQRKCATARFLRTLSLSQCAVAQVSALQRIATTTGRFGSKFEKPTISNFCQY